MHGDAPDDVVDVFTDFCGLCAADGPQKKRRMSFWDGGMGESGGMNFDIETMHTGSYIL